MRRAQDWLRALTGGLGLPRPPSGNSWAGFVPPVSRSDGAREREDRHDAESAAISGIADMLEMRYRAQEVGTELEAEAKRRGQDGFREEADANLAYDFMAFGMHTLKTLLELNVRAHRKLTHTLRAAAEAGRDGKAGRESIVQPMEVVELLFPSKDDIRKHAKESLGIFKLGKLEIVNQRGRRLGMRFGTRCVFRPLKGEGKGELTLHLAFLPESVDLAAGESREVLVYANLTALHEALKQTGQVLRLPRSKTRRLHGVLEVQGTHGDVAPIRASLDLRDAAMALRVREKSPFVTIA